MKQIIGDIERGNTSTYVCFHASIPKVGKCANPQYPSFPVKNHWKNAHKKLIEKYFLNP
jgi:hypothetical protein